ncbi:hypothetical protein DFP72DRAFT_505032 [Ephemerocybe angulata]|uniref:Uncharacterized protein n=1 Tax=Ephemerocybe angulata TaxID=980116 RepID=A0A8H6M443_9AGAR|nr:hypothetical protein DFP72DRAFT_505032 [Tulosesus angulatus]
MQPPRPLSDKNAPRHDPVHRHHHRYRRRCPRRPLPHRIHRRLHHHTEENAHKETQLQSLRREQVLPVRADPGREGPAQATPPSMIECRGSPTPSSPSPAPPTTSPRTKSDSEMERIRIIRIQRDRCHQGEREQEEPARGHVIDYRPTTMSSSNKGSPGTGKGEGGDGEGGDGASRWGGLNDIGYGVEGMCDGGAGNASMLGFAGRHGGESSLVVLLLLPPTRASKWPFQRNQR